MSTAERIIDIRKAAAIIIQDGKLLVCREYGKDVFVAPGGKLDDGETPEAAVIRELAEELAVTVRPEDLAPFGTFYAEAATNPGRWLEMTTFMVTAQLAGLRPSAEIEELAWLGVEVPATMRVGSIFEHEVLPRLVAAKLVR